jgi:cation diffusion facilitator family transporter
MVAAIAALVALAIAARPPDEEHAYGHSKVEYFSSGFEGALILIAAVSIGVAAVGRLFHPQPIEGALAGIAISILASAINFGAARVLLRAGRRYGSISLEADAHHLMTDVWTSAGVVVGVGAVALTGWTWLDPLIAIAVAVNIIWIGVGLMRRSALGLLDTALPAAERAKLDQILDRYQQQGIESHALRTRQAGMRRFVSLHVLVPGSWTVQRGHALLEDVEQDIRAALPNVTVFTHLEPLGDPRSWEDMTLDRKPPSSDAPATEAQGSTATQG